MAPGSKSHAPEVPNPAPALAPSSPCTHHYYTPLPHAAHVLTQNYVVCVPTTSTFLHFSPVIILRLCSILPLSFPLFLAILFSMLCHLNHMYFALNPSLLPVLPSPLPPASPPCLPLLSLCPAIIPYPADLPRNAPAF